MDTSTNLALIFPTPPRVILGPCRCHDCHAPGLFYLSGEGWQQRDYGPGGEVFGFHRCTARAPAVVPNLRYALWGRRDLRA